jgi:thioredoxin 1
MSNRPGSFEHRSAESSRVRRSTSLLLVVTAFFLAGSWMRPEAARAADSLGEQARLARKPLVVDFGMTRCSPCIEQGKVMDRLKATLGERLLTRFVHIGKEEALAKAHKVLLIPTIVIFDAQGREVFRNVGFLPYETISGKLRELKLL